MDARTLIQLSAFLALAITAAGAAMVRHRDASPSLVARPLQTDRDALRNRQRQCQQLGEAGARDMRCLQVWAETRDRFLHRAPSERAFDRER